MKRLALAAALVLALPAIGTLPSLATPTARADEPEERHPRAERDRERVLMAVVEGRVARIDDGVDAPVVLHLEDDPRGYALAPAAALEELGFDLQVGDRLRMRVFLRTADVADVADATDDDAATAPDEVLSVQKAMNLSRDRMLRLRTLHRDPLWEGGSRDRGPGPHGPRGGRQGAGPGGPGGRG